MLPRPLSLIASVGALGLVAACVDAPPRIPSGAEDFATYCASCHGASGTGNAALGAPDLTGLAAREGGFPRIAVMSKIWGYVDGANGKLMPEFGGLLESDIVFYDAGDGIATPTPLRLVQLMEYLERL
jgi:mono/diheme cytochrome c family protein